MDATLGLDTSTATLAVAVTADGSPLAEEEAGPGPDGRPGHATELLPAIERAVAAAGGWERIGEIAVGIGPGTFTGLRIGVATARALALSRALPLAGVSSLAALAAGIDRGPGEEGLAVIDAKRGEAFAALYGHSGEVVWEPFVAQPDELAERLRGHAASVAAAGDGSLRFRTQLEAAGVAVPAEGDPAHRVRARHICDLAAAAGLGPPEAVEPTYLRRPDAELWRERDRGRGDG